MVFKTFSWILPDVFQYFGVWLLACFMLQAYFAWKLLGTVTNDAFIRLLGTGFFVFSYPFLMRIEGHFTLVGQFVIVAALYFNFAPTLKRRILAWSILLTVTAALHPYLLVMVGVLWIADLVTRLLRHQINKSMFRKEAITVLSVLLATMWLVGYFTIGSAPTDEGFGYFRSNLLSLFDSNGWSFIVRGLPQVGGDYEGAAFLGSGVIALGAVALFRLFAHRTQLLSSMKNRIGLLVAIAVMGVFALSNNIGFGSKSWEYPLPQFLVNALGTFRASGRMIWPLFYLVVFGAVAATVKLNRRWVAIVLVSVALLFQLIDSREGWQSLRMQSSVESSSKWASTLQSPLWNELATHYSAIRWVTGGEEISSPPDIAYFAATHGMATNAVSQARVNLHKRDEGIAQDALALASGNYSPNTLYILSPQAFLETMRTMNSTHDSIANIDGLYVLVPNWKLCIECTPLTDNLPS